MSAIGATTDQNFQARKMSFKGRKAKGYEWKGRPEKNDDDDNKLAVPMRRK